MYRNHSAYRCAYLVLSVAALVLGICIYVLLRDFYELRVFGWLEHLGMLQQVLELRRIIATHTHIKNEFVLYNLPDGLWVSSFTAFFNVVWGPPLKPKIYYMTLPLIFALGSEFGQLFGLVPGTFDPLDLLAYLLGWALVVLLPPVRYYREKEYLKKGI